MLYNKYISHYFIEQTIKALCLRFKYLVFLLNSSPGRAESPGSTRSSARSAPAPGKRQGPDVSANRGGAHCQKNAPAWKLK